MFNSCRRGDPSLFDAVPSFDRYVAQQATTRVVDGSVDRWHRGRVSFRGGSRQTINVTAEGGSPGERSLFYTRQVKHVDVADLSRAAAAAAALRSGPDVVGRVPAATATDDIEINDASASWPYIYRPLGRRHKTGCGSPPRPNRSSSSPAASSTSTTTAAASTSAAAAPPPQHVDDVLTINDDCAEDPDQLCADRVLAIVNEHLQDGLPEMGSDAVRVTVQPTVITDDGPATRDLDHDPEVACAKGNIFDIQSVQPRLRYATKEHSARSRRPAGCDAVYVVDDGCTDSIRTCNGSGQLTLPGFIADVAHVDDYGLAIPRQHRLSRRWRPTRCPLSRSADSATMRVGEEQFVDFDKFRRDQASVVGGEIPASSSVSTIRKSMPLTESCSCGGHGVSSRMLATHQQLPVVEGTSPHWSVATPARVNISVSSGASLLPLRTAATFWPVASSSSSSSTSSQSISAGGRSIAVETSSVNEQQRQCAMRQMTSEASSVACSTSQVNSRHSIAIGTAVFGRLPSYFGKSKTYDDDKHIVHDYYIAGYGNARLSANVPTIDKSAEDKQPQQSSRKIKVVFPSAAQ
jgi:hypothetical protein